MALQREKLRIPLAAFQIPLVVRTSSPTLWSPLLEPRNFLSVQIFSYGMFCYERDERRLPTMDKQKLIFVTP